MLRFFYAQLPDFARPEHPVMRYLRLREGRRITRRGQIIRILGILVLLALLFVAGMLVATQFGRVPLSTPNPWDSLFLALYWPLVAVQFLVRILAMNATVGVIATEIRSRTWETLKITTDGALLTMKARWATAFYRLWLLLTVLVVARAIFIVVALTNVASFQGHYLDLLLTGSVPFGPPNFPDNASIAIGILILALTMTAAMLAPFTAVAFDAALGMLIGSILRGRFVGALSQIAVIIVRLLLMAWGLWVGAALLGLTPFTTLAQNLSSGSDLSPFLSWLGIFFGVSEGDLGLTMMHMPHVQKIWIDFNYGILVGVAFLGYVLLQAILANLLVRWAARRALRADMI